MPVKSFLSPSSPTTVKKSSKDGLFLLEVLIDKVVFSEAPCFSDKGFRTCVSVECPLVGELEVCDDEPGGSWSGGPFSITFNSGKSCLFSMKEAEITQAKTKFPLKVQVFKSLPCGCIPTKIPMGQATIDMTKEFIETVNKFETDPSNMSYQALKDKFQLFSSDGPTGEISMYFRISCFGNTLVTKFQGVSCKPALGGGGAETVIDRSCNPERAYQTPDTPCACGASRGHGARVTARGSSTGQHAPGCPKADDLYNTMPCTEIEDDPCYCCGPRPQKKDQMACRNTDQYCLHVPKGQNKQFEEVGTTVNGNELKIKVPASASIIKKISQTHCALQRPYVKGGKDKKGNGPCNAPCGKNQISLAVPCEAVCCDGIQHQTTQFTCTTEGCTTVPKHNPFFNESRENNPNKDTFVLKVAKTAMQGDRKCRMEIELVAPKGSDKKPFAQKVNTNTQSEFECICGVPRLKKSRPPKCCPPCCH